MSLAAVFQQPGEKVLIGVLSQGFLNPLPGKLMKVIGALVHAGEFALIVVESGYR